MVLEDIVENRLVVEQDAQGCRHESKDQQETGPEMLSTAAPQHETEERDGNDDEALEGAREQWRGLKGAEHELTYWQQDASGRWNKQD